GHVTEFIGKGGNTGDSLLDCCEVLLDLSGLLRWQPFRQLQPPEESKVQGDGGDQIPKIVRGEGEQLVADPQGCLRSVSRPMFPCEQTGAFHAGASPLGDIVDDLGVATQRSRSVPDW